MTQILVTMVTASHLYHLQLRGAPPCFYHQMKPLLMQFLLLVVPSWLHRFVSCLRPRRCPSWLLWHFYPLTLCHWCDGLVCGYPLVLLSWNRSLRLAKAVENKMRNIEKL